MKKEEQIQEFARQKRWYEKAIGMINGVIPYEKDFDWPFGGPFGGPDSRFITRTNFVNQCRANIFDLEEKTIELLEKVYAVEPKGNVGFPGNTTRQLQVNLDIFLTIPSEIYEKLISGDKAVLMKALTGVYGNVSLEGAPCFSEENLHEKEEIKTISAWAAWGASIGDFEWDAYAKYGDVVEDNIVQYFQGLVTPEVSISDFLQIDDHSCCLMDPIDGKDKKTFFTFQKQGENQWTYCGHCFYGESVPFEQRSSEKRMSTDNLDFLLWRYDQYGVLPEGGLPIELYREELQRRLKKDKHLLDIRD